MNPKVIRTLEFNKILERLEKYCSTYLGRAICNNTQISTNMEEIKLRLEEVTQLQSLILRIGDLPLVEVEYVTDSLKKSEIGGILSFQELLNIAHVLKLSREIKEYITRDKKFIEEQYTFVLPYFDNIYSNNRIETLILDNILDNETINDKASKDLFSIRRSIKQLENKIRDTLNQYITNPNLSKYLQDNIITIRNDRFVIPVKQEFKSNIKGLVHDTSSSGSTLFIEPNNIVDLNNQIKEKHIEEKEEIEKILLEYSQEIAKIAENINSSLSIIGKLDHINAKAKYSLDNDMYEPNIVDNKYIKLIDAKHPLIEKKAVVPISLEIDTKYNSMIITGPNTGGKTVTLKTIGLLTLMTQYGMHIPAKSSSTISIFKNIFTDIGDEQSIEQNLSTFSSHMVNLINITSKVTSNSMVIIDELGSGTDPIEGAALAQGILEFLLEKKCLTICTTHYSELKTFAMSRENILNACTEFNIKTLKPTYNLILGIPGKSNAFAISEKLGLDKKILEKASTYITKNNVDFETVLAKIEIEKKEIEKIKKNTQSEYSKIKLQSEELEKDKLTFETKKNDIISNAKYEAQQLLLDNKENINKIIDDIYNSKTLSAKDIQSKKTNINNTLNKKIKELSNLNLKDSKPSKLSIKDLRIGQQIHVISLNKDGNIVEILDNSKIRVQIGIIKTDVFLADLQLIENKSNKTDANIKLNISNKSKTVSTTLNVMGKTVDEAIYDIEKYLDDAHLAKLPIATILHGKGTGALRKAIHDYLKTNRYVKSYRIGGYSEGQEGVTILEIK